MLGVRRSWESYVVVARSEVLSCTEGVKEGWYRNDD